MKVSEAIDYLSANGAPIYNAPAKWQRRGFTYFAPTVGQMLTAAQLVEFATNERELRS